MYTFDRLDSLSRIFQREAFKCHRANAYLAACVMQASALEALLQSMCYLYPKALARTHTYQQKRFRRKQNKALELTLNDLITVASEAGWFPTHEISLGKRKTTVARLSHAVRKTRNLVHPGVQARQRSAPKSVSKAAYTDVYTAFFVAVAWLQYRVYKTGMSVMKQAGIYEQVKDIPPEAWFGSRR